MSAQPSKLGSLKAFIDPELIDLARQVMPKGTPDVWVEDLARDLHRTVVGALERYSEYLDDRSNEGDLGHLTLLGGGQR